MKCVLSFVCDVHCNGENPLPFSEGVWSMCNTMPTGRYGGMAFNSGRTDIDLGTMHVHYRRCMAYRQVQLLTLPELDIHWVVHRNVRDQLDYREVCAHWVPKDPTDDDRVHCMGLHGPFLYAFDVTRIRERSFGAETRLITQNLKPEKGCVTDELSSPSSKENGSTVISKDDNGDTVC